MKWLVFGILIIMVLAPLAHGKYSGGTGTSEDPYQIATAADLLLLAADANDYNECFILTADINLGTNIFTTALIAADGNSLSYDFNGVAFAGIFDGAGRKIINLTINTNGLGNDYLGLFGFIDPCGAVKDLSLEDVNIVTGDDSFFCGGLVGLNNGSITNCYSKGAVTGGNYSYRIGGLVGNNYEGSISNCRSTGTVTVGYDSGWLGGLAGENFGDINSCYSIVAVVGGDDAWDLGGLVGENLGTINNCYSRGAVAGGNDSWRLGGLVGKDSSTGTISKCFSAATVTSGEYSYHLGGLVGENFGTISGCYFLVGGGPDNGCGTPLTDEQMRQQASFVGWDFVGETANGTEDIWRMCIDMVNYPLLWWQFNIADFSCPDGVDFIDFAMLANAWLSDATQDNWNGRCDIAEPLDVIDILDLVVFCSNWLRSDCVDCGPI